MRKIFIVSVLILMVCGLISNAYAERKLLGETLIQSVGGVNGKTDNSLANTLKKAADKTAVKPEKIKFKRLGATVGREIKILDSQGKPVKITDEKGKPVSLIIGKKGNLVVQKPTPIGIGVRDKALRQGIARPEKPTLQGIFRPQDRYKPKIVKP